jgi:signal transduction histidine kinase/CheY-like chemotaxis protein
VSLGVSYYDEYRIAMPMTPLRSSQQIRDHMYRWYSVSFHRYKEIDGKDDYWLGSLTDVTDKHDLIQITTEYKRQNSMFMTVMQQLPAAVIIAEAPSGRFLLTNSKVEHVLGQPVYATKTMSDFNQWVGFHPDGTRYKETDWPLSRSILHGEVVINEVTKILTSGNRTTWISLTSSPIFDDTQRIIAALVIIEQLDEKLRLEEQTIQALSDAKLAQEQSRFKSTFIANVSHDLRTPIASIVGIIDLLQKRSLEEDDRLLISLMSDSVHVLESLINDILDISKIEAGKIVLNKDLFSLKTTFDRSIQIAKNSMIAYKKHLEIQVNVRDLPDLVKGDEIRFMQIMNNVLNNAVKFTDDGGFIAVSLSASLDALDKIRVTFICQDTGEGMSQNMVRNLFKPFSQGDTSRTRRYSGTGLGLHIVRNLVNLMGGDVTVISELGQGSTFTLHVYFDRSSAFDHVSTEDISRIGTEVSDVTKEHRKTLCILLADDNSTSSIIAVKLMEIYGYTQVDVVIDGLRAVNATRSKMYDVILMDCIMPVMDGFQATKTIRKDGSKIPIIAFTASAAQEDINSCYEAGMNDVLLKPYRPYELVSKLDTILKTKTASSSESSIETAVIQKE